MDDAVNWRIENEEVILTVVTKEAKTLDVKITSEILKEIIVAAPPSDAKKIRELISEIHRIRKTQLLMIEDILKSNQDLMKEMDDAVTALKTAGLTKTDIRRWEAIIRAVGKKKAFSQERRHLTKLLMQREGELRAKLMRLETGK